MAILAFMTIVRFGHKGEEMYKIHTPYCLGSQTINIIPWKQCLHPSAREYWRDSALSFLLCQFPVWLVHFLLWRWIGLRNSVFSVFHISEIILEQRKARHAWVEEMQLVREQPQEEESTVRIHARDPYPLYCLESFLVALIRTAPTWVLSEDRPRFTAESPRWVSQTRSSGAWCWE